MHHKVKKPVRIFIALICITLSANSHSISVSISDTVVVLDSGQQRSGKIDLLNLSVAPIEFEVQLAGQLDGVPDGREYLRWAPEKTFVEGNTSRPLRMVFRPPSNLPAGEYVARFNVRSKIAEDRPSFDSEQDDNAQDQSGLGVGVAIQPVLPVTIYMRHEVRQPEPVFGEFQLVADGDDTEGVFDVSKATDDISYMGTVAFVGKFSRDVYAKSRLRMGQTQAERRVRMTLSDEYIIDDEPVCLHVWNSFPGRGEPDEQICSV